MCNRTSMITDRLSALAEIDCSVMAAVTGTAVASLGDNLGAGPNIDLPRLTSFVTDMANSLRSSTCRSEDAF